MYKKKFKITFISDTHTCHKDVTKDLVGGDILIHAGDIMNSGYSHIELDEFCKWFNSDLVDYKHKIFIAGNHDRLFEDSPETSNKIVGNYKWIDYLQDESGMYGDDERMVKVYGSPWQPEFYNWAFNLPKNGQDLMRVWNEIPKDVEILVTHGPPQGILDISGPPHNQGDLGCSLLRVKVDEIKPKIHVFGHIHGSYGYKFMNGTHFINASILNESYRYTNKPLNIEWYPDTNELIFV
ncbi:metallophosphatase domain-containing protein [Flavobacteriaceae bacterium]|nr:metallophosphatase domain-containing protein [bacterium]MDB4277667.1 metallophosphatase domain-containing protein [Gammaproteobacteria bacterium]MDB4352789.1 metallophosphatase domain-containing protein [Porticoccaceae bacterium]MDB9801286.1 metallophosphatase domain-containing protein [Flavobacteriaceae bacterium]